MAAPTVIQDLGTNLMANANAGLSLLKAQVSAAMRFQGHGVTTAELVRYVKEVVGPSAVAILDAAVGHRHALEGTDQFVIHYTNVASLFKMLQQGHMRLYDTDNTNDPQEGDYFNRHARMPNDIEWIRSSSTGSAYVASFVVSDPTQCRRDDLVYWRTYGDSARGCSIEFSASGRDIRRVLYGEHEIDETISTLNPLLQEIMPLTQLSSPVGESVREIFGNALYSTLPFLYKSEDFKYEHECRLVVSDRQLDPPQIKFDTRRDHNGVTDVRHYCIDSQLQLESMLARSGATITLGPAMHNQTNITKALKLAFRKLDVHGTVVKCSRISFQAS